MWLNLCRGGLRFQGHLGICHPQKSNGRTHNNEHRDRGRVYSEPLGLDILQGAGRLPATSGLNECHCHGGLRFQGRLGTGHLQQIKGGKCNNSHMGRGCTWFELLGLNILLGVGRLLTAGGLNWFSRRLGLWDWPSPIFRLNNTKQ